MSQALATFSQSTSLSITQEEIHLIKNTIAQGATEAELKLYFYDCQRQGVHPLDRMIHFTKRGGKYTPVVSIDYLRARAEITGEYAGNDDPVFDNEIQPGKAMVTVYKMVNNQRCAFTASARWDQYYPGESGGHMWRKMPHLMLGKCAEALALRKAFPKQFAGIYTHEEMQQAGNEVEVVKENSETRGHNPHPFVPSVSVVKEVKKEKQSDSILERTKAILNAKEVHPEVASLLDSEPNIINVDLTTPETLETEQPPPKFGDPKQKSRTELWYDVKDGQIFVYNSYTVRDKLKRYGFMWNGESKTWQKDYSKFDEDNLKTIINKIKSPKQEEAVPF